MIKKGKINSRVNSERKPDISKYWVKGCLGKGSRGALDARNILNPKLTLETFIKYEANLTNVFDNDIMPSVNFTKCPRVNNISHN